MSEPSTRAVHRSAERTPSATVVESVRRHFEARRELHRGICLINAGQYANATEALSKAADLGCTDQSLATYLAACLLGRGRPAEAAEQFARTIEKDDGQAASHIGRALSMWSAGRREDAIRALRASVRDNPECAELHFQLGTLLTRIEEYDEAELRFTQAINIDRHHAGAMVSLAMCAGLRGAPGDAVPHLQRAQRQTPGDVRINLLLARAADALRQQGHEVTICAEMPGESVVSDQRGVDELSFVIATEPDFVDAFLSISVGEVNEEVFALLLETLRKALERQPEQAELHYHCGRVLDRIGRPEDAIRENERAVEINPRFTRALIELGKLYHQTDRAADATTRLEQAVAAGAEYADVYYLLGNLYRKQGEVIRARGAYRRALTINGEYHAAQQALASLPAQRA